MSLLAEGLAFLPRWWRDRRGMRHARRAPVTRPMHAEGWTARPMTPADEPLVWGLCAKAFPAPPPRRLVRRHVLGFHRISCVLLRDSQLAAYVLHRALPGREPVAWLFSMATDPALRGQGLGGRILDYSLDALRHARFAAVRLEVEPGNDAARRLYESRAFLATGTRRGTTRMELGLRSATF